MPKIGHFVLHSNVLPQLTAGRYELRSEQTELPFSVAAETTHMHVSAPRFTMPIDQIISSFPPANAEGAFGDRLPQIALKRRTLPWERNPAGAVQPSATPWLALVVVAEGEAELSTTAPVTECVTPGVALLNPEDKDVEHGLYLTVTETVVKKIFPCQQDLALLTHVREVDINDTELANGDDDGWLAVVLANRLPVFDTANNKPVRYMACLVNVEGQLAALPLPQPDSDHFKFELAQDWSVLADVSRFGGADKVIMGNLRGSGTVAEGLLVPQPEGAAQPRAPFAATRLPERSLMSATLDGGEAMRQPSQSDQWLRTTRQISAAARDPDAKRLVRDTMGLGFRYPIGVYALEKVYRFPVLAHWSFTTSEGATFETLMQDLDVGLLGTLPAPKPQQPGKPEPPPQPDTQPEIVATGHIGLDHRVRRGDAARAWYRGACVPLPTPRDGASGSDPLPLAHAADQLRRVIPDGREDLSLAAAFEIGRLLALSQLSVVSALLRFRSEQFGAGRVREILSNALAYELPQIVSNAGPGRLDFGRFVAVQVIDALAQNPEGMLGPQRPVADPGREIRFDGDLDSLVATGLGFDLAGLKRRSETMGLQAALEATSVPVAGKLGQGPLDENTVTALRGALQAELSHTLEVAAPQIFLRAPGVRAAAAPPDALDALIENAPPDEDEEEPPAEEGNP
jgi:hypothetical protein